MSEETAMGPGGALHRAEPRGAQVEGLLAVDKDCGPTSHGVVGAVRRILGQRRVGHCGTLDPLATGVLLLCLGRHTRLAELLSDCDKEYHTTCRLGATSDTYDAHGEIEVQEGPVAPTLDAVEAAVERFRGVIMQTPPAYSAIRINGVRAYKLARRGKQVKPAARQVTVHEMEVTAYEFPQLTLRIKCSKGTYVRALAHDLGQELGCGALVEQLRRTRVGAVGEPQMIDLAQLESAVAEGTLARHLIPVGAALPQFPRIALSAAQLQRFSSGIELAVEGTPCGPCLVSDSSGQFWGLGRVASERGAIRPWKVMPPATATTSVVLAE